MTFHTAGLPKHNPSLASAVQHSLAAAYRRLSIWRHRQEIISELGQYSPRELAELGISAADIPYVAESAHSDDIS